VTVHAAHRVRNKHQKKGPTMTTILKPGILVSLKTVLNGGVSYARVDLENSESQDGAAVARWETKRTIQDPDEHERATKARSAAANKVRGMCAKTAFGLLCPQDREAELDAAMVEARELTEQHNAAASFTQIHVYMLKGRIASTDEEAARAIASDVRDMLDQMEAGVRGGNPEQIREAANRARDLGAILGAEQQELVSDAIKAARSAARAIIKRVEKKGEDAALVIQELTTAPIARARFAFLDTDGPADVGAALPAVTVNRFAELDEDEDDAPAAPVAEPEPTGETLAASAS
jgi:hypothetical protein